MTETFGKRYLTELEQLLQAEAELRRQGTELLDDPEYRALRERFIEGEITLAQLSERVDTLAMTRGEDDVDMSEWRQPGEGGDGVIEDDADDGASEAGDGAGSGAGDGGGGDGGGD